MRDLKKIAIFCQNAYPVFDQSVSWGIGGMETRAALLASGLARSHRWQISMVVSDFGQPRRTRIKNIDFEIYQPLLRPAIENVLLRFHKRKWLPVINLDRRDLLFFWHLPLVTIYRLLPAWICTVFWRRIRSDIVCCFGNNSASAQVIADCLRLGIPTILSIASDDDLAPDYSPDNRTLNDYQTPRWMAHYALENASHIFVQTENQLSALESRFGRQGHLIHNPVQISGDDPVRWPQRSTRDLILWIGRSDTFHKQPLLLLELAKRCPDLPFLMIMNRTHADVFEAVQAQRPENLTIVERVPYQDIWGYYLRARVFVSTSAYEGFPNTFLQCAVTGVPVASLAIDPEGILSKHACGLYADGNLDVLERQVRALWSDAELAECRALSFHRYALAHHGLDSQVKRFEFLLQKVIESPLLTPQLPWWRLPHHRFVRRTEI